VNKNVGRYSMKPLKSWPRPLRVVLGYLAFLVPVLVWLCWESGGGRSPAHRVAVIVAYYLVLPLTIASFLIHLTAIYCSRQQLQASRAVAVVCGLAGLLIIYLRIRATPDPDAAFIYFFFPIFFAVFAVVGFVVSALAFYAHSCLSKRRKTTQQGAPSDAEKRRA
jgi:heme/copper-type cytochrome/quinol oxidase subunit 4